MATRYTNKVTKQLNSAIIESFNKPIRMCIICRNRFSQKDLYRFQVDNGKLINFTKSGRSFYICQTCIDVDIKKLEKTIKNRFKLEYKDIIDFGKTLKELSRNV